MELHPPGASLGGKKEGVGFGSGIGDTVIGDTVNGEN